jgi:hypothetical protein
MKDQGVFCPIERLAPWSAATPVVPTSFPESPTPCANVEFTNGIKRMQSKGNDWRALQNSTVALVSFAQL